jgi:phenol hydroxylase P4 protein
MPFGDIIAEGVLPGAFGYHPDFARSTGPRCRVVQVAASPSARPDKSLAENGLKHKDVIRFRTPGLTGIKGSLQWRARLSARAP